jgi:hypothetical protein
VEDRTGLGTCSMASFGISNFEPPVSATRDTPLPALRVLEQSISSLPQRLPCPFEAFNYDRLVMLLPIFHIFGILRKISWQVPVKPQSKKFEQNFHIFWCMVSLLTIYKYFMYTSYNMELSSAKRPKVWGVILLTWSMTRSRDASRLHIDQQNGSSFYGES